MPSTPKPPSQAEKDLEELQNNIAEMPPKERREIQRCYKALNETVEEYGAEGVGSVALARLGLEMQIEAEANAD